MTFSFSFLTLMLFLGFGQAATISGILIFRRSRREKGDNLLNILFFLTLYLYLTDLLIPTGIYRMVPFFLFTDFPVLFLVPPILFLYVKKMVGARSLLKGKYFQTLHFIPFAVIAYSHLPHIFMSSADKIRLFQDNTIPPPRLLGIDMTLLGLIQYLLYLLACFYMVSSYRRKNRYESGQIRKIRNILLFYLIILICLSASFYNLLNYKYYPQRDFSYLRLILDFPIFVICIYNYILLMSGSQPVEPAREPGEKYRKSGLSSGENRKIFETLCRIIEKEKLWSDPDMDLRALAEKTGYSYHHLSQVINQSAGINYHSFINRYRIGEACRLLESTEMTVLDIAFTSGFNSKPTFNKVFKEEKNCTPTQYRENRRKKTSQ